MIIINYTQVCLPGILTFRKFVIQSFSAMFPVDKFDMLTLDKLVNQF